MASIPDNAMRDRCQVGAGPGGDRRDAARGRRRSGEHGRAWLILALALFVAGCGGPSPARCTIDDLGDQMVSTRAVFLERLAGCPIGGRH